MINSIRMLERRTSASGFVTVDEYVADVLQHDLHEETENFDYLFTPERLAHIDRAAAQIDAGRVFQRSKCATTSGRSTRHERRA